MDPPAPAPVTVSGIEDDEWELCNDDGFVYKRRKRRRVADSEADAAGGGASEPPDPSAEEGNRRLRRQRILMKLKRKYQREMDEWKILWNSLSALQEKANQFQTQAREEQQSKEETASFEESSSGGTRQQAEDASVRPSMVDELVFMAEAQEAMLGDGSNLCEVAEEMCRAEEEEWKEPFFDLPLWCSPTHLMSSLCDSNDD